MSHIFLLASIGWIVWVYFGYPAALALLSLYRRVRPAAVEEFLPFISVLIAARNEENDIGWKIAETLAWNYPTDKLEILVASDSSDDATDQIVTAVTDPRVRLARMERRGGKGRALNRLAEIARGEIYFFTDANAHVAADAPLLLARHFADPRVGCVTGETCPISDAANATIANGAGIYRRYESLVKRLESRLGSVLTCDGAIFCIRSSTFHPLNPEIANDVELPIRVGAAGMWTVYEPMAVASERETGSYIQEFNRRRRMCAQGVLAASTLSSDLSGLRSFQLISHKLMLWLSILPMIVLAAASLVLAPESALFAILLGLQVAFYGLCLWGWILAVSGRQQPHVTAVPFFMLLGLVGALLGAFDWLRGRRFDVWEVPVLSRGSATASATQRSK